MDYSSLGNRFKRNSQEATLDDLEYQMATLGREEPLLSEITEHKDILSANAINSYLNPSGSAPTEGFNEQIGMIEKAILEEKNCPNILQFQTELYANISEIVDNQDQGIKDAKQTLENKIFLNIYALEVERIKYLLKSYLRIRLFKIEKFATYIIRNKLEGLLSRQEAVFLKQFFEVKQQHFKTNLLNHLPSQFRSLGLDPKYETINNEFMVQEPDLEKAVIVRVVRRFEKLNLDIANSQEMDLMPGEIYCFKYKDIKNLHEMGVVEFV